MIPVAFLLALALIGLGLFYNRLVGRITDLYREVHDPETGLAATRARCRRLERDVKELSDGVKREPRQRRRRG